MLIFQVDLWNARGDAPANLAEVAERRKQIIFSSRTRNMTDQLKRSHDMRRAIAHVLRSLPPEERQGADYEMLKGLSCDSVMNIVHLIYRNKDRSGQATDYEFSDLAKDLHWEADRGDERGSVDATVLSPREPHRGEDRPARGGADRGAPE